MDGDNNLEKFAIQDFNELETVETNEDIHVLVQIDRHPNGEETQGFTRSNGDWNETRRYVVKYDLTQDSTNFTQYTQDIDMWSLNEENMGDSKTLQEFLEWGITNYPSERYMVVMWDHGTGIFSSRGARGNEQLEKAGRGTRSFCEDMTNGGSMTLWELDQVLQDTKSLTKNNKFDIVGFDMCWLGHIETGYEIMDSVDFLVASSDEEPDVGWNYGPPVRELEQNPEMTGREFAITITNKYIEEFQDISTVSYMTQATVDLNGGKPIYADIYHFAELISENEELPESLRAIASEVMEDYDNIVIAEGHGDDHPNGHGLSAYFPKTVNTWYSQYETSLDFAAEKWDDFLKFYLHPLEINHTQLKDTEKVGPHEIKAVIRGNDVNEDQIYVHYTNDGANFQTVNLKATGNVNECSGLIGNQSLGTTVHYYLEAIDTGKYSATSPSNATENNLNSLFTFYVGLDKIAPDLEHNQTTDLLILHIDQPYNVSVKITDNMDLDADKLFIYYNTDNGINFTGVKLTVSSEPGYYFGKIPAQSLGTILYYYFEATDIAITPNTARLPLTSVYEIEVVSARPVPSFTVNKTTILTFENVKFTSTSTDDSAIVNWTWEFGDGKVVNGPEVIRQFYDKGEYPVTLTVIDDTGFEDYITQYITVENRPPEAKLTPDNYIVINGNFVGIVDGVISKTVYEDDEITFYSNASSDKDGYITTFNWDFGDGVTHYEHWIFIVTGGYDPKFDPVVETFYPPGSYNYSGEDTKFDGITTHKYPKAQEYTITLTVTDVDGGESNTSFKIKIENKDPTATPGYTSIDGRTVSFSAYIIGSEHPDSESDIATLNYTWDFGDGSIGHGINITHKYRDDGKFGVMLTVTDDDGSYDKNSMVIEIGEEDDGDAWFTYAAIIVIVIITGIILLLINIKWNKQDNDPNNGK
jgi:PKD repeat protein